MAPVSAGGSMSGSLAAQLRLGFGAALLMTLGVVAGAWWGALNYGDEIDRAYETQLRTTVQLAEAQSAFWQLRVGLREFMNETLEGQHQILEEQDKLYAIVEAQLAAYDKAASSKEERRTLTSLRSAYQRYQQVRPKFFELWQAGHKDDALAWVALATAPFGAEAARQFEAQIALQQSFVNQAREQSARNAKLALALVTAITIALLAILVTGYAYAVRLLRPIRTLRTQAERMVREQLGETIAASSSSNEVAALVESFQLMSDRLLARTESLRQSRERLDFLLRATPAVIYAAKAGGDYGATFVSPNVRGQLGYAPEDFLNDSGFWASQIHPDDREHVFAGLAVLEKEDSHVYEYRFRHKDGSWRWMHNEFTLIRDSSGAPRELVGYWIDVTERVMADKEREQAQQRLQLALEGGGLAMWDADAASGKVWLSKQWTELLGESPRETWTTVEDLVALAHPEDRQRLLNAVVAVMKGERPQYAEEHRVRTVSGEWRWLLSRGRVTERAADGRAARMSGTNLDITERKRAEAEVQRLAERLTVANRALEQANRTKTDFMANVTHELRTPLNSVIGFAELLKDEVPGPLNAKQAAFAADIFAGGQRLLALVEGILEMSRLDANGAVLKREPVEIGAALEGRVAAHRKAAEARGLTMRLDVAADTGSAELDPKALQRMLNALLDNAIKFNREGGAVAVRARRDDGWLEIAVADTGLGIAREDLPRLFRPLVQLDAGLARKHCGIGLGLALARKLAELHGGTIEVESEPGKGSTFTLRLPVREDS